jgi:hypothetical protein
MLLLDSRKRCLGCLVCFGLNGAVIAVSVIALFIVLIVWCIGCSECTSDEVDWSINLSFEIYIFPERNRKHSYATHVDKKYIEIRVCKIPPRRFVIVWKLCIIRVIFCKRRANCMTTCCALINTAGGVNKECPCVQSGAVGVLN